MPPSLPPPQADVVVVTAPRLPPLAGEATFDAVRMSSEVLRTNNRLDEALKQLTREHADSGRAAQFEILQGAITKRAVPVSYSGLAARLGTSEGAVQQAVKRLRKRYREILRERIAATLDDPDKAAIDAEIRDLFTSLGG